MANTNEATMSATTLTPVKDKLVTAESVKLVGDLAKTNRDKLTRVEEDLTKLDSRKADAIISTASGENITITDSDNEKLVDFKIFGKSTQNGVPTELAPIAIENKVVSQVKIEGKNLFDLNGEKESRYLSSIDFSNNRIKFKLIDDYGGCFVVFKKIYAPGKYVFKMDIRKNGILENSNRIGFSSNVKVTGPPVQYNNYYKYYLMDYRIKDVKFEATEPFSLLIPINAEDAKTGDIVELSNIILMKDNNDLSYEDYHAPQIVNLASPITLRGIKTNNNNNNIIDSVPYMCDSIEEQNGVFGVNRILKEITYNNEKIEGDYLSSTGKLSVGASVICRADKSTFEPFPIAEQNALKDLSGVYHTMCITNDGNAPMEVSYVADTKNFILNRESAMQKQISDIQKALISQKISGGGIIKAENCAKLPIKNLRLFGKSTQNGVPSPTNPIPIVNIGDKGNINVSVDNQKLILSTPSGLLGIKVSSNGNYTDITGQQWVCDRIIEKDGVIGIERNIGKAILNGSEEWQKVSLEQKFRTIIADAKGKNQKNELICNRYKYGKAPLSNSCYHMIDNYYNIEFFYENMNITSKEFMNNLKSNPVELFYVLGKTTFEPLSPTEQDAFRKLYMNYPITTISNDENADMELEYTVDTKSYIDKKIAEISGAVIAQKGA